MSPTLTLSGTCEHDVVDPDTGYFAKTIYRVRAAASGLAPNTSYTLQITESPSGQIYGFSGQVDSTGAFSGHVYSHGWLPWSPLNPPPSVTLTGVLWVDVDHDGEVDPGEPVLATDTLTIVCPLPPGCGELVRIAQDHGTLRRGEARSLLAKLKSAEKYVEAGEPEPAQKELTAFLDEVRAMIRSGRVPPEIAGRFIRCAEYQIGHRS